MPVYTGRVAAKKGLWSRLKEWIGYTVVMGGVPLAIRWLITWIINESFKPIDCRAEIFFLTIVFLVDSLKNYSLKSGGGIVSLIILVVCAAVYGFVSGNELAKELGKSSIAMSDDHTMIGAYGFLVAGTILDFVSIIVGGRNRDD